LAHIDALIMPSLHEGLPYTVLEAMSMGVPIIASRVGGVAEVLEDGETAVLFHSGDVDGLVSSLLTCAQNVERTRAIGLASQMTQSEKFNLNLKGKGYWALFSSISAKGAV